MAFICSYISSLHISLSPVCGNITTHITGELVCSYSRRGSCIYFSSLRFLLGKLLLSILTFMACFLGSFETADKPIQVILHL